MAFSKPLLSFLTIFSLLLNLFPLNLFSPETALANPSGWLSGYSYRKAINIDNTQNSSALTNYQVSVDTTQAIYNETGLVGSWHMNEGSGTVASDMSGNSNNGALTNGPTWTTGKFGSALSFDGADDYVNIPYSFLKSNTLTISFWLKTTSSTRGVLFGQANQQPPTTPTSYVPTIVMQADGKIRVEYWTGAVGAITSSNALNDGVWHYISFVGSGTSQELFIDSVSNGTRAGTIDNSWWTYSTIGTGYDNTIRGGSSDAWRYFNGLIDEVRIYNRALSAEEVANHYNATKARLDYGDVRFTDSDGTTLLNYWQESDKKAWIKVPTIPANSTKTIYMYYGNSSATSQSNGDNTFVFFDDFNGTNLDSEKWTIGGSDYSISNSKIMLNTDHASPGPTLKSIKTWTSGNYLLDMKVAAHTDYVRFRMGWENNFYNYDDHPCCWGLYVDGTRIDWGYDIPSGGLIGSVSLTIIGKTILNDPTTYIHEFSQYSSNLQKIQLDAWADSDVTIDRVLVRNYTSPEPTTSFYAEQSNYSFNYRRVVTIDNTSNSNNLYNYQVSLTFDTSDTNKFHNNCSDIRFTDNSISWNEHDWDISYPYWIESGCGTSSTKAWIKVPTIPANSTKTIYMYYGNSSATSQSNGDNTFVFFDDFNSDTSANYVVVESGTKQYDSTNKVLKQTNTSQVQNWIICSADSLPNNYVYQADVKIVNDPPNRNHAGLATDFSTSAVTGYRLTHLDTIFPLSKWSTGAETSIGSFSDGGIYADNKWLTERVYRNRTTGLLKYEVTDGITTVSGSYTDTTHTTGHLGFHSWGCEVWYDNVLVRNYTSPEPTTILGSETLPNQPPVISSVFVNPSSAQVGVKINFQIDWTDEDGDETKTHICKTDSITEQTCDDGAWCETTDWSGTSPSVCEYQTQDSDIGTQNYYIFVCDDKNNCSVSHSGNFQVSANQPPTISSAAVSSTSTAVGVPIEFSVDWSDPGDMIKMHICRTNSLTNQTCDGGFYCESSDFTTDSPSTCLFTPQISDLGTNTFYAFVCDSAGNCSDSKSGSFEVYEVMESGYLVLATTTSSGFLISSILDTGVSSGSNFHTLIWQGELCNNCQVRIQLASSNSPSGPWLYYGPTSTDDYYQPFANSLTILPYTGASSHQNKRYIRYKIELVPYEDQSPRVDSISINYTK